MSSSLSNFEGTLSPSTLISILVSIYIRQYTGRFVVNNTRKTRVIGILAGTPVWINRDDMERSNSNITDAKGNILIKNDRLDVFLTQTVDVMLRLGLISQRPIEKLIVELKSRSRDAENNQDSEKVVLHENIVVINEDQLIENKIVNQSDIQTFHVQQNIESLAEILSWKSGTWKFEVNDDLQLDNIDPILLKIHPKKYSLSLQMPYVICYASTEFVLKQQLSLNSTQLQETGEQEIKNQDISVFSLSKTKDNSKSNLISKSTENKSTENKSVENKSVENSSIFFHQLEPQSKQEGKTVSPYEKFVPPVLLKKIKEIIVGEIQTNHLFDTFSQMIKNSHSTTNALFFPNDIYKPQTVQLLTNTKTNTKTSSNIKTNGINTESSDRDMDFANDYFVIDGSLQGIDKEHMTLFFQLRNCFERFSDEHILLSWIWIATQLQIIELKEATTVVQQPSTTTRKNIPGTSHTSYVHKEHHQDIQKQKIQDSKTQSDEKELVTKQVTLEPNKDTSSTTTDQSGLLLSQTTVEDANRVEALQRLITGDYRKKVGQNFYVFLGLDKSSSKDKLQKEITKLRSRWENLTSYENVRVDVMKQAKSLLTFLSEVEEVMLNDKKKREYDRELLFGRATIIGGGSESTTLQISGDPIDGIRHLVDNEDYQKAIPHLEEKRREKATSEVLALLGWCLWNTSRKREAEDIISLSLTIGKPTTRALKYATQIALEQGKKRRAKRRLLQLLQIDPENDWAKDSLSNL